VKAIGPLMTSRIVSVALSGPVSPRIPARNNRDTAQSWLTKTPIKIAHFKFSALKASKLWMCRTLPAPVSVPVCGQCKTDFSNVRSISLLTSRFPSLGEQGARFRTTRLAMMAEVTEPARTIRRPQLLPARSKGQGDRSVRPRPRRLAPTAACRLRSFRRSSASGTPTASIL